jgi:tetraacyldisaccharide-1-P 4'-kinase
MRPLRAVLFIVLLAFPAAVLAARALATASIVVPVHVAQVAAAATPSVSIAVVDDGAFRHVTVAFN